MEAWTEMSRETRTQALQDCISKGLTASAIARQLGTSRNAVCGALARYGLSTAGRVKASPVRAPRDTGVSERRAEEKRASAADDAKRAAERAGAEADRARRVRPWEPLPGASPPLPLHEVSATGCSWPLWSEDTELKLFCGEPAASRDYCYCRTHMLKAYARMPTLKSLYGEPHV